MPLGSNLLASKKTNRLSPSRPFVDNKIKYFMKRHNGLNGYTHIRIANCENNFLCGVKAGAAERKKQNILCTGDFRRCDILTPGSDERASRIIKKNDFAKLYKP